MREVDYLTRTCHLAKQPENLLGPEMVKGFHYVIGNEWHGRPKLSELVVSRKP